MRKFSNCGLKYKGQYRRFCYLLDMHRKPYLNVKFDVLRGLEVNIFWSRPSSTFILGVCKK